MLASEKVFNLQFELLELLVHFYRFFIDYFPLFLYDKMSYELIHQFE